jgi:hypothetical protein
MPGGRLRHTVFVKQFYARRIIMLKVLLQKLIAGLKESNVYPKEVKTERKLGLS